MPTVELPTLHAGQVGAYQQPGRFKAVRCGRRWGKTLWGEVIACDGAAKGQNIGIFAPDYKILAETFGEIAEILAPIKLTSSRVDGVFRTTTGGRVDYWSLDNERAGRSRKYHKVIIDEAAFTKPNMMHIWRTAIKPALLDYQGSAYALSTPNGTDEDNFFWRICNEPEHGFVEYHAPTHTNPYLPAEELAKLERENHPLVYRQEYLAEFVNWDGVAFFALADMLVADQPVEYPAKCDAVFAIIDTAVKDTNAHDGTAVSYYAVSKYHGHPLILLDWDIISIEGASLEIWLPTVFQRLEDLAKATGARNGSIGAFIEDKVSGSILLQQARNRGLPVHAIDSKLTAVGKSERAISVSGYVYRGLFKIAAHAYHKVVTFKGASRNHWLHQVLGFRVGAKDGAADDLLDTMTYGIAIALGNQEGY